jgi:hypothetical protein
VNTSVFFANINIILDMSKYFIVFKFIEIKFLSSTLKNRKKEMWIFAVFAQIWPKGSKN